MQGDMYFKQFLKVFRIYSWFDNKILDAELSFTMQCLYSRKQILEYYFIMPTDHLTYSDKKELPDEIFGLPERREYPMPDAAHVRAAEAYFRYCPESLKPRLARAILQRARLFGVNVKSPIVLDAAQH